MITGHRYVAVAGSVCPTSCRCRSRCLWTSSHISRCSSCLPAVVAYFVWAYFYWGGFYFVLWAQAIPLGTCHIIVRLLFQTIPCVVIHFLHCLKRTVTYFLRRHSVRLHIYPPPPRHQTFFESTKAVHRNSVPHCRIQKIWNTNAHWPCQLAEWLCRPCPKWERTWRAWSWWQMVCVGLLPPYSGHKPRKCMCIKTTQISVFFICWTRAEESVEQWEMPLSPGECPKS